MKYSLTFTGLAVLILSEVLRWLGITAEPGQVESFVDLLIKIVGAGLVWFGRFRLGGVNFFGMKK